jgi:hypothetical protein
MGITSSLERSAARAIERIKPRMTKALVRRGGKEAVMARIVKRTRQEPYWYDADGKRHACADAFPGMRRY